MKLRFLSIMLCICMVFTLLPVTAWAAAGDHADKVKVAGTELTATGYYDVSNLGTKLEDAPASPSANGYVHWESTTGTLTLYGATIDGGNSSSGIYANQNYTIILSENTVSNVSSEYTNAVTSDGSITIKGSGTLNATGATNGIDADYTVSITDGATVNAIGASGMGIYISYRYSYWDGLRIESDAASVTIAGKTYGVGYANTGTLAPPEIKNPNVTVTGETAAFQVAPKLNGVGAKASGNINGTASETYVSTKLSDYKWFRSEALPSVPVTGVTVDPASLSLTEGDSSTLTAAIAPDNATNKTATWTSSDPAVATVGANGKVTAVAAGTATITVTTEDGAFSDTCVVTVAVSSVTNYNLWVGGVQVTSANAADVLGDGTVSYDHNTKTLTLNNATITNWHEYGNNDRSGIHCEGDLVINLVGNNKVIQQAVATNSMEIGCSSYAVHIKDQMGGGGNLTFAGTGSLTAASADTNAGYANSWSVAIYTFGIVKVRDNCTITAYCGKSTRAEAAIYTDTLTLPEGMVAVGNKTAYDDSALEAVQGRNNDYKYMEIAPGYTVTLNTVFGTVNSGNVSYYFVGEGAALPTDVTKTGKTFAGWYDNAACTGEAVTSIAANATGAKEYWAKWTEDDSAISVTGMTLNKATLALFEGDSSMLTATVAPTNATNKTVTWTSSDPAVATVDANGKVTAMAAGTATITATTEDGGKTAACAVTVSHDYTAQTKKAEALKAAGNCRDYAVYYYSCSACGKVENIDSHTFNGGKVPDTHVGGSHVAGASEPDHKTQAAGSTGATLCDGCNATLTPAQAIQPDAHTPANVWSNDETSHWYICSATDCGAVIDSSKAAHTPDRAAATETDPVKCSVCGYEITPALGHTHAYSTEWMSDKDEHWNECACGDTANTAVHKDENTDGKCDVCTYDVGVPTAPTDPSKPSDDAPSPQAGDGSDLALWIVLLIIIALGLVSAVVFTKKRAK